MLKGEYLLIKSGFLKEYASHRLYAQKNIDSDEYRDFSANRFEKAVENSNNIYSFDGINATIRIEGPLSVEGPDIFDLYCGIGGCSYLNIDDSLSKAAFDVDPEKGEVFIKMNTPGGTVDGCDATFQAIWSLSLTHNVIVENMGLIASAGVWLSSAAHKIITKTPVALTGSIGVVVNTYDFTGMLEDMGIEQIIITNFESPDKIPDLKTEKGKGVLREELDAIYNVFRQRVLQGRDRALGKGVMSIEDVNAMTGRVFITEKSIELGLLDNLEDSSSVDSKGDTKSIVSKTIISDENKSKIDKENQRNEIKNNKEGKNMKLSQFLAENPEAKAEHDASLAAEREKGAESVRAVITAAAPFIESDSYPAAIKTLALKTIKGDTDAIALVAAVAAVDAAKEGSASLTAKGEVKKQPETPPGAQTDHENKKGKVETVEDYGASVNNLRKLQGMDPLNSGGAS